MRKIALILLFMLPLWAISQTSYLDKLFDKYAGQEGYTSVYITQYMFELFAEITTDEEQKEFNEATSKLTSIKMLKTGKKLSRHKIEGFKSEVLNNLPTAQYKDLMVIKDSQQDVLFKVRKNEAKIVELLMFVASDDENLLICLSGDIDLKKIVKLSKSMKIKGMRHLNKIKP